MSVKTRKEFQEFLRDKGYYFGAIDGIIGSGSKKAILACFQNKKAPAITTPELVNLWLDDGFFSCGRDSL